MAVKIGSARIDENGNAHGGKTGDQKGGAEVSTQSWYKHSKKWYVYRAKDPVHREIIAKTMQAACDNQHIGYDQYERNSLYTEAKKYNFDVSKVTKNVETDCSALVRVCLAACGIDVPSDFRTGNMPSYLSKTGKFDRMSGSKYEDSSDYLKRGDILVTQSNGHTVVVLSNGSKAESDKSVVVSGHTELSLGDRGAEVKALQNALLKWDATCLPKYGADGDFGSETYRAVKLFQKDAGLTVDGIVGPATWAKLESIGVDEVTVTGGSVNIRRGAGTQHSIVKTAHRGDVLAFTETTLVDGTVWYHVSDGWVSGKYAVEV